MSDIRDKLSHHLKNNLTFHRYSHCLGTEKMARRMAIRFNVNPNLSGLAGLAHDICREHSEVELKNITGKEHINPIMLHGEAGAILLKKDFFIEDRSILNAVHHHISGSPGLDKVGKIVFASDYMEEGRTHLSDYDRERLFSLELDDMVLSIARSMSQHLLEKGRTPEPALLLMIEELS
jgi:predicted HD superfamily hydrolase involved in NAD metabolism